jgi:hypothetical protein
MRSVPRLPIVSVAWLSVLVGCAELPEEADNPDVDNVTRIGANRIGANRIGANRIGANRLSANRLSDRRLSTGRLRVNMAAANTLLATEDGREVFSAIVSCALPDDTTLVARIAGTDFEFTGEMNLAPQWLSFPLDPVGEGWVSACMFAKVNANDVALPVSFRGPHPSLGVSEDERVDFSVEEGAFFGTMFGPLDKPIQWFACRGEAQAAGEFGGLTERDCAEPDPTNPGFTRCGFKFAGDCGEFAARRACESFSDRGTFYRRCHTTPIRTPIRRDGHGGDRTFSQVITIFVTP